MKTTTTTIQFHRAVFIAILALVAADFSQSAAMADTIIYSDTFARIGGLNGSQLGVAAGFTGSGGFGGSSTASWAAAASITTNGTSVNGGAQKNAYLPFTPEAGHVYTYTIDLDTLGSGYQWAAMGFNVASQVEGESYDNAIAWALQWQNAASTGIGICKGPGYAGETNFYPVGYDYNTLSWVLDTRNATWTARFFINSVAQGDPFTYTANPGITNIGFASSSGLSDGYSVRNLSLSVSSGDTSADYYGWASANGVTGGPGGDSDHDGISNLTEYALDLNPSASDGSPGTLTGTLIVFTKRSLAVENGDVTYAIEESANLGLTDDLGLTDPWNVVTPLVNNNASISYALPSGRERVFVRLKVSQN
jgi:hypothetical protein